MSTITIITIVVIALLTVIIFGLAWLGYSSCLKTYQLEVRTGKYDRMIFQEYHIKQKRKGVVSTVLSYSLLTLLLSLFITGLVYKTRGENLTIGDQTVLVIKTDSMSDFFDDTTAESFNHDRHLQFDAGDICFFEEKTDLVKGEVYGYKYKDIIITHRLIEIYEDTGYCKFKGDNCGLADSLVQMDNVVYHYTGHKIPGLGAFVLYAQSLFGLWSLSGIIGVMISTEVVYYKINGINKKRDLELKGVYYEM